MAAFDATVSPILRQPNTERETIRRCRATDRSDGDARNLRRRSEVTAAPVDVGNSPKYGVR
jgi:hypothetical protein